MTKRAALLALGVVAFTLPLGAGSGALLPKMWELAEPLVTDAFAISLADAAAGVRVLAERGRPA